MVHLAVIFSLPEEEFPFVSSFETLLQPERWQFTVQHFIDEIYRVASVDLSRFHDDLCAFSITAGGFSFPHNYEGVLRLLIWIPAFADHTAHIESEEDQIEMELEHYSFDESFDGGLGFGAVPATREAINALNAFIVGEEEYDEDQEDQDSTVADVSCAVCLEDIVPGEEACAMPCSHVYHSGCIRRWLEGSRLCPLCRVALE